MMTYLARGITILVAGLAPEVVIIVGDCTAPGGRGFLPLAGEPDDREVLFDAPQTPQVVAAMDGDAARLRGAAALVLHKVLFRRAEFEEMDQQRAGRPGRTTAQARG